MYNKKVIIDAIKNLNKAKTFPKYNNAYTNNKPNKKNSNNITSEQGVNTPVFKSVHAAPSKIHGKGLFTQEPISKGDTIGVSHIRKKFMKNNEEYQAPFPSKQLGYYNHSESPNVYEVDNGDHIIMKAKRNINPGEELTANYYNANIKDLENPDNFKKGGATNRPKLPNKKNSKAYSRSFEATNRLFAQNPLFSKPKSRKNKIFDPNAKYYANGGEQGCPQGYAFNPKTGECIEWNPTVWSTEDENTSFDPIADIIYMNPNDRPEGMSDEEYNQMYQDQLEHEQLHRLQWLNDELQGESKIPLRMPSPVDNQDYNGPHYYNRRQEEADYLHDYWKNMHPQEAEFIPDDIIYNNETDPAMYQLPWTVEGEARDYEYATHDGMPSFFPKRKKGGALSKFLDGGPQCPEGYTYNPETKRCTRKNTNCPEGYFFDAQEGRCKSKVYREKFELYNKDTKITPTEEEESYSYWPDDLTLKDLDKGIMISPEGFENDRPFLINPIKTIGIYNPEKYEEDIDDRYLADTYVNVYPDLNYQVVVDPSKPKGYNADKSIYYVPDENNFEFEKFKQYKKLKEIEKENLSNLAKYPNLITKEWQEDYKYRPQDDPKLFLDAEYYGQGLPGYYTNLTDVPFDKYKNSIKRKFNTGCKDCKYHYGTSHEYNDDYNINLTNLGHVKKDFKSKDPSYYIRNIKEHDYVDLPDESMIPRFDLESADTPIYREGDPSMLVPHMRLEPGKTKSKKNRGRLIHGKGQKYKHTTYRQTKDLEFGTHKTNRPIPALVQKFTGYDPKYYQGYDKEVGDETEFVPGEIERAEQEGRKVNFKGAATLRDLIKQKKYDRQWKQKDEVRQRNEDYLKEYNITPEEYEQYYGPFRRGGQLPKAQYGLTGLGKDRGVTASPFDFRTPYGQSNDFFKNPNYSLTYTTPNLFKKLEMAANPLSFTIGRPYYTDVQRLTHPSLDTDAIYTQDYFGSSWQGQFGPEYEQYLQDVSDYSGVPVSGLNQTILNKYNAAQNLAAVKPTYKKGIPLTANVEYSLLGNAFGDKSTGPFSGALTFGAGYAPEPGFYGSVDASAYGVFGKRKNNQKIRPNHYFNKGLTRQGDRAWIPRLNIFNTVVRQRPEYNDAQTQKILELYKEDIERGTTTAEDFMADNEDQSSYNRYNISALSPEVTFLVKPFKDIPGIFSATVGLRNTLGGKDKSETTVGGQWTSRPYGNIRYSIPVEGAIDRLKDLDLPPIKKRKSYYDYANENEQTDDNNEPPTDNTFPPEDTSTDENTMQPSYDGEGVGKGPCPKGYERLCEKCRCTKIKTPRSPLLDKRGIHPYIDGKYLEDGGITVDLTPEEIEEYAKGGYIIEDISVPSLTRMQDGGLPKAFEGRPVKIKEKEKEKEKESEKINAVNTNIQNLGTDYRPNVTAEKTSFNLGNFIKPLYDISKIKTDISKALAKSSTTQFLNATRPMEMALIKDLKNQGLISETLPEEILTTYPNLLDLATRRGIQKANTVFRGTRPFIGNSNILRSSENTQTALPLEYFNYLKSLPSDVARAAYMSSHISPINVGARVGLDHVIGMTTPMDALYYSRQNVDNPSIEYTYGPLQTELRFPFDFSEGNASTWLQKYREMPFRWKEQEDGSIEKNREYAPGVIHNIDIFTGGKPGNEGAILGLRNQRVLEPVRVRYNETFKNLEDQESLNNYLYEIMSKRSPEEQSDYITHFNNEILPQLDVPKDYLKDRGFKNFGPAESLYNVHNYLYHHNRYLKDIAKKPSNIQVIPYSPFSFKFKEGGQFELGDEVELTKEQLKKLQEEGYTFEIVK